MMLLLVAGAAALVAPGSRPSGAVACRGAAYDYCVQSLGCTAQDANKAEGMLLPNIAESMTRAQADQLCSWLQSSLDLSDAELKRVVMRFPALLSYSGEDNLAPKLAYLEREIGLSRPELREHVLRIPAIVGYSLDKRYRPRVEACRAAGVDPAYAVTTAPYTDEYFYARLERMMAT